MALLQDKDRQYLVKEFGALRNSVKLVLFTGGTDCQYCDETRQILDEVSGLSDQIALEVHPLDTNRSLAAQYGIAQTPAIVILQDSVESKDYGIRYYGIPSGYEFTSLIHDILMVGAGESGLSDATKQWVAGLKTPIHLQVFVTPTCPYCPQAVLLAHKLAMESDLIQADMVEAMEFPELAEKYEVMGVPRTVINEDTYVEGAVPEARLLQKLKEVVAVAAM